MAWYNPASWGNTGKNILNAAMPVTALIPGTQGSVAKSTIGDDPASELEDQRRALLYDQGAKAGGFADRTEQGFGALGREAGAQRDSLRQIANGRESISAEQLRQALQQNQAAQASQAAGAPPSQAAGAARLAAIQMGRQAVGLAGQQAVAGLQERQAANQALANMILQQRGQDLQATLGARGSALDAYGANNMGRPPKSWTEIYGPTIRDSASFAASDRNLKTDVRDGDEAANKAIDGLRAFVYKYKDKAHGEGDHLSGMAQDYERAGLESVVVDTPRGKMVHGAKLAGANTAMIAALGRRVRELEVDRGRGRGR